MTEDAPFLARIALMMDHLARWSAVAMMFGATTSKALVNLASALVIVGWILGGRYRCKLQVIARNPATPAIVALIVLLLVGASYSIAPGEQILRHLYIYGRLPIVLMLVTLLAAPRWRDRALLAFAAGAMVTLASTYANVWFLLPWSMSQSLGWGESHHVFMDHIAQGIAMSIFAAMAIAWAHAAADLRRRTFWIAVALLSVFSVTHLLQSRTAHVVLLATLGVALLTLAPPRWRLPLLAATALLPVAAALSSPLLRARFAVAHAEFQQYLAAGTNDTSIGARLDMWKNSLDMFAASPWIGHGTGAYRTLAEAIYTTPDLCAISCSHPHNQFLFFAVELGLLGLIAYALLLALPLRAALRTPTGTRLIVVSFVAIMFIDSFVNAPLWVTTERLLFISLLGLILSFLSSDADINAAAQSDRAGRE